jgi:hypothetical protein
MEEEQSECQYMKPLYTLVPELFGKPLKEAAIAHQFNVHRAPSKPDDVCDGRGFGWHTAPSWTLATLPRGTKKWTFVTRENLMYLRPFAAPTGVMFSWWGHEPKLDEKDAGLYAQIPTQSYVQEAGDVIYLVFRAGSATTPAVWLPPVGATTPVAEQLLQWRWMLRDKRYVPCPVPATADRPTRHRPPPGETRHPPPPSTPHRVSKQIVHVHGKQSSPATRVWLGRGSD